jgi:cellulose synthase/poly-beta-1,6-N-acetylglucosamine synthase-like glycosyltransferase
MTFEPAPMLIFWSSSILVVYAYACYPMLIWVLSRLFGSRGAPCQFLEDELPRISLLIAAYNEESVIGETVDQALLLDYPADRLEIIVASDGSSDETSEVVRRRSPHFVRLLDYPDRRGKAAVLNESVPQCSGEIVMFSDANTAIDPDAPRHLVRWFRDPSVGVVVGRLILTDPSSGRNADSLYWKYETFMKRSEGRLGCLLGANGAIYAVRKRLYQPIPDGTIIDDFVGPLLARMHTGCRIVYEPEAIAREETAPDVSTEFQRRARIGAGGFQSLTFLARLLDPRQGLVAFSFLSHKVLRWLCPFFLLGIILSNLVLIRKGQPFYWVTLVAQFAFYLLAAISSYLPARLSSSKILRLSTMFTVMNVALLVGFARWLLGNQSAAWRRTTRAGEMEVVQR